jgi:succinoglycan biosynthesis protein ExoM
MFNRDICLTETGPFDTRLVVGEDVWFLRDLVEKWGARLIWCADAAVSEIVPASRITSEYAHKRKFRNGQLRCLVEYGGRNWGAVACWMAAGLVQTLGQAAIAAALFPIDRELAEGARIEMASGLGKIFWWWQLYDR